MITLQKTQSTVRTIFGVDFRCENTYSLTLLMPSIVTLSISSWGTMVLIGMGCSTHNMHRSHANVSLWDIGILCWWILEDSWKYGYGVHKKFRRRNHSSVRGGVRKKTSWSWCWSSITRGESPWFSWYTRKLWLYALKWKNWSSGWECLQKGYIGSPP